MDTQIPAHDSEPAPHATSPAAAPNGDHPGSTYAGPALIAEAQPRHDADREHPLAASLAGRADRAEAELDRLRRLVREQLAAAVAEQRLDIDLANGMLEVFGLPELPRRWTVRLSVTFVCEVTAGTDVEAFDTAEDAIADAVANATCSIDVDWDSREKVYATPGEIDHDHL
jgi:hypothetical protein